ncbi:restriction endonuclease [Halobellus sp. H-GB7]|uniref:restriction endonuclease n=1 Tax=Halobellus sp. H-GB7 TaxID=3069756 RepID=UPI0027B0EAA4|nr:restriction endonuclease [Halobellus sp. H-GB7]MDQ2053394.1 restriction endonuclease [Halobellus sp. H-GB7]
MIPELEPEDFVAFLADLWRERGWEISVKERADETRFVIGERGDGKRGVIYAFPTTTATVTERHLKQFVAFCRKRSIDVAVVATQGAFADGAKKVAAQRSVHLLDRATLAETVEEGGFEDVLKQYTETSGLEAAVERLQELGVPVPVSVVDRVPDFGESLAAIRAKLDRGDGDDSDDADASGAQSDSDPDSSGAPGADAGVTDRIRALSSRSLPATVIPIVLVVAFVLGAALGPALGLGGPFASGGDDGLDVSAISTASANATADVRWNAKTTQALTVNGTTYDAPDEQTFLLVRMNVTNRADTPTQFAQSKLAVEVAGERYAHQPLDGVTGFPSAGLFEPGESREVWTVFSVPADGESATLLMTGELNVRFTRDTTITPEATVPERE